MDEKKLEEALSTWVKMETWHTKHATDMKFFHQGVQEAFKACDMTLDVEQFRNAIFALAKKHHKEMHEEYLENTIEDFAERAAIIVEFLEDIS